MVKLQQPKPVLLPWEVSKISSGEYRRRKLKQARAVKRSASVSSVVHRKRINLLVATMSKRFSKKYPGFSVDSVPTVIDGARNKIFIFRLWKESTATTPLVLMAHFGVASRMFNRKKELSVEHYQGKPKGTDNEPFREFRSKYNISWNIAVVNELVRLAYEQRYDRALLQDQTTTIDYIEPFLLEGDSRKPDDVRSALKQLVTRTRKECGFSKVEWRGGVRYFVREFP